MPKVSIIVAAYNVDIYLGKCIESVMKQSLNDIEIIIVNDGSTDETPLIIKKFSMIDNRIKVVNQENGGVSKARNTGIDNSSGEYLFFLDGDDWIDEFTIEKLYINAKRYNSDIVCYNYYYAYEDKNVLCRDFKSFKYINTSEYLKRLLLLENSPTLWSKLIKREVIFDNGIRCPERIGFGEDMAMGINICIKSKIITYIDEPLYFYRQRDSSISQKLTESILSIDESMGAIKTMLNSEDMFYNYREEYEYLIYRNMYYYLVIVNSNINEIHKNLYYLWKSKGIIIQTNKYYTEFYKEFNKKMKLKCMLYDKSYYLGSIYCRLIKLLK